MAQACLLDTPQCIYRGTETDPDRWRAWNPRVGDILVCTPPKSGTTWAQTILTMLINGGPDLPEKVPVMSPWIDGDLGIPANEVAATLDKQQRRRVIKTHTPADGFPVWDGVTVIAVYRHPLDVFFSMRKHIKNMAEIDGDHPMLLPVSQSLMHFVDGDFDPNDWDNDNLATLSRHYRATVLSGRLPGLHTFHYAEMIADGRRAVERLAQVTGIEADNRLIEAVAEATAFGAMKSKAKDYAPVGGTGFWKSDAAFFDSASSRKWEGQLSEEELALYKRRLAERIPDVRSRAWLENGDQADEEVDSRSGV